MERSSLRYSPRLLPKKPAIAFLDESTSALDEKLRASGIVFVSVGHRSTPKEFHDRLLMLRNDGASEIVPPPKAGAALHAAKA